MKTMGEMIKEKKQLIRKRQADHSLNDAINQQIDMLEEKMMARVSKSDQNLMRVFYRTAKEMLAPDVFTRIEDVASTRHHQYKSQNPKSH